MSAQMANPMFLPWAEQVTTASPAISLGGATLPAGVYNYKVVFVDADGNEGLASAETRDITFNAPQNAVHLLNLPVTTEGFVSRRIYRSEKRVADALYELRQLATVSDLGGVANRVATASIRLTPRKSWKQGAKPPR